VGLLNQGSYDAIVCGHVIKKFTIYIENYPYCNDNLAPIATSIAPTNYVGLVGHNHTIHCYFVGDLSSFDYITRWLHSRDYIANGSKYNIPERHIILQKNCSYVSNLTILHTSIEDSGSYECYSISIDGQEWSKNMTSNAIFIDYPVIETHPYNTTKFWQDHLGLKWTVSGPIEYYSDYIIPGMLINGQELNITQCDCYMQFERESSLASRLVFNVSKISQLSQYVINSEDGNVLRLQIYLKFQPFVNPSEVISSQITYINIKTNYSWLIIVAAILSFVVVCLVIFLIAGLVKCCKCYKNNSNNHHAATTIGINHDDDFDDPVGERNPLLSPISVYPEEEQTHHQISFDDSQPEENQHHQNAVTPGVLVAPLRSNYGSTLEAAPIASQGPPPYNLPPSQSSLQPSQPLRRNPPPRVAPPLEPAPSIPKIRVSVSSDDEFDITETDGPISTAPTAKHAPTEKSPKTIDKVFILYCNSTEGASSAEPFKEKLIHLVQLLTWFSNKGDNSKYFTCEADIIMETQAAVTITNWCNWTETMIKQSTHVLVICTPQLYNCLKSVTGCLFYSCMGPIGSDVISNLFTDPTQCSKFIPVFLNCSVNRDYIPTSLGTRKCYELHIDRLIYETKLSDMTPEESEIITDYLEKSPHMQDLLDLIRLLRKDSVLLY
jgi:hypothetical protein